MPATSALLPQAAEPTASVSPRWVCCVALFLLSYAVLIPGLFDDLFSLKAEMFGMSMVDITKSTVGTIGHLYNENFHLAALLVLLFSVVVPVLKLVAVLIAARRIYSEEDGKDADRLVSGLQWISKWATVDAFCVMTFAAAFSVLPASAVKVDLQIHRGFYCFLAYCVLSVAAALALPSSSSYFTPPPICRRMGLSVAFRMAVVLIILALFLAVLWVPLIEFHVKEIGLHRKLSMESLFSYLWKGGLWTPAAAFLSLAMIIPGLHALLSTATELDFNVPGSWAIPSLGHFAMADVLLLSIGVSRLAGAGLTSRMSVEVLPGGRGLLMLLFLRPFLPWAATAFATQQRAKMAEHAEEL